jgi:hypothetical protein
MIAVAGFAMISTMMMSMVVLGLLFFKNWGHKFEDWGEVETVEEEAYFVDGLGYVFKDDPATHKKKDMDEGEICYLIDKLRDVHTCICKNGQVQKVGRRINPVTQEPECPSIQLEVPDESPYRPAVRSKVSQVNPAKLHDLSCYCR